MRKGLLTIGLILTGAVSYAQVIFSVTNPASIAGNYDFTYAGTGTDWGVGDLLDPLQAVEDTLMFVEDGSAGLNAQGNPVSREGCNPLINNLSGKIAVVYRNTCEFGTKAFNAQEAGARAVIIVNREDALIAIGGGTDGINVTIPVIFVSSVSGQIFIDKMNNNQVVTAFIGNKTGLYDNDLGLTAAKLLIPSPATNHSLLSLNAAENSQKLGSMIYNYGNNDQTNVSLKAEVLFGGSVVYSQTVLGAAELVSGDSILVNLPDFSISNYPVGTYTLNYYVLSDATDEYDGDNFFTTDFYVSSEVFAYAKLDANGKITSPQGYRASDATTSFGACIHFQDPNASRTEFEGIYFSATSTSPAVLLGQEMTIDILSIDEDFVDLNTAPATINFTNVNSSSYIYEEELQDSLIYAPLTEIVYLEDNKRYLVCVTTFDANTFIGYSELNYQWVVDTLNQPVSPVISNDAMNLLGFGDPAAAIAMKLNPNTTVPFVTANGLTEICEGQSIILTSSIASGNQWNLNGNAISGETGTTLEVTTSGTYTVTANGNTSDPITTTVNTYPAVPTITADITTPVCAGNTITLTSSSADNNRWSNGATTQSITLDASGVYTVDVNNGVCVSSSTESVVTINPLPDVFIQSPLTTICIGSSIDIVATGAVNYEWNTTETNDTITVSPIASTTYSVIGVDGNGCVNNFAITIDAVDNIAVGATASSNSVCIGETVTIDATGAIDYVWDNAGETTSSIVVSPTITTTYTVVGTLGTCEGVGTVTVTVNGLPTITATADLTEVCAGSPATLTGAGGSADNYTWDNAAGTGASVSVTPTTTTTYTVTGTDGNGCSNTGTVTINVNALPTVTYTEANNDVCNDGASFTLSLGSPANGSYSGDGVNGDVFNPATALPNLNNAVTYTFTDGNGCTNSAIANIFVNNCSGIAEGNENNFVVYPNPTDNVFTISGDKLNTYSTVEITDQLGRTINTWKISSEVVTLDVSKIAAGNYNLILTGANGNSIQKVQIK